jgi:hypothetical protein
MERDENPAGFTNCQKFLRLEEKPNVVLWIGDDRQANPS